METIRFLKKLRPFKPYEGGIGYDRFVRLAIEELIDAQTLHELSEFGRARYTTELHYSSFDNYRRPLVVEEAISSTCASDPLIQRAIRLAEQDLRPILNVPTLRLSEIDKVEFVGSSSAGYGYKGKKRDNFSRARYNARRALKLFKRYGTKYEMVPDKAFFRTHLAKKICPKVRHVWGRSFHNNLIEGLIGQNILKKAVTTDTPFYVGHDLIRDIPPMITSLVTSGQYIYGLDYKHFDASVNSYLIDEAWRMLYRNLKHRNYLAFNYCEHLFKHTPVIMPDGKLFEVNTGVPSGSLFTSLIDSIINLILLYAIQLKFLEKTVSSYVLGDDSIFVSPIDIDLIECSSYLRKLGFELNLTKTFKTKDLSEVIFLGHHYRGTTVSREDFELLGLLLYPEEEVLTPQHSAIRCAALNYDTGMSSYLLLGIYNYLLTHFDIDWSAEKQKPITVIPPFSRLYSLVL